MLIMWIYKAKDGLSFSVSKSINLYKQKNILDINWDWNITEKEKLTIILSFVPFVWFLLLWKYKDHETIQNSIKMNVIISLAISLLFIFWYWNLSSLLLLIYIIIITFIWINLFTRNQLLQIKLPKIFSFEEIYIMFLVLKKYLVWYVKSNSFKDFSTTYKFIVEEKIKNEIELEKQLSTKNDFPLPKPILYIPIINLISVFSKDSKYSIHKANWIILTIVMIISLTISYFWYLDYGTYILFLFPILFWIWFLNYKLAYKIPVIYDIYFMIAKFFGFIKFGTKRINEKRKEKVEVSFKVENKTKSINNIEKLYNNTETKK